MSNTLAIIPARGGSKGVPRKNIRLLAGEPLLHYSMRAARQAKLVDRWVVSTEDDEIAAVATAFGAEVIQRPPHLADDRAKNEAVMRHTLDTLERDGTRYDTLVLLQPTSPLRTATDVDAALETYHRGPHSSVLSLCEVEHHPAKCLLLEGDAVRPLQGEDAMVAQRQTLPNVYRQNGAIYVVDTAAYKAHESVYLPPCGYIEMPVERSIDIDREIDFAIAEVMIAAERDAAR